MPSSKQMLKDITRSSIYRQLKGRFYYPYYLSGPKVGTLFAQLWGDIKSYSEGRAHELSEELGLGGKTSGLLSWLAELAGSARIGAGQSWSFESHYDVPDLARFLVLHRFLESSGRVNSLSELTPAERDTPHLFVEYSGSFSFEVSAEDLGLSLSAEAIREIGRRKNLEEHAEKDSHFVFSLPAASATALVANRYLSHYGHRFLPHYSESRSISFFGSTIGESAGLLFLDPIAIGYQEKGQNA